MIFATIRPSGCRFRGLARAPETFPGLTANSQGKLFEESGMADLDELITHWQRVLPELGNAFANGDAAVDPVDADQACTYCDLTSFCRIRERDHMPGDAREGA